MSKIIIEPDMPVIGIPFAAPGSGKDTTQGELTKTHPHITVIHMSTLLGPVIEANPEYKKISSEGGLLPPEEAIRAWRRGFIEKTRNLHDFDLSHIFGNGRDRDDTEARANFALVQRLRPKRFQHVGFHFELEKDVILRRAFERGEKAKKSGRLPRPEDLGDRPFLRYQIFESKIGPVLQAFEKAGGVVVSINANLTPKEVAEQITSIYDQVELPVRIPVVNN